jgi:hypothetical protein
MNHEDTKTTKQRLPYPLTCFVHTENHEDTKSTK